MTRQFESKGIGFDNGFPPVVMDQRCYLNERGELVHEMNGQIRATVPPEGFDAYCGEYETAQKTVDKARLAFAEEQAAREAAAAAIAAASSPRPAPPTDTAPPPAPM